MINISRLKRKDLKHFTKKALLSIAGESSIDRTYKIVKTNRWNSNYHEFCRIDIDGKLIGYVGFELQSGGLRLYPFIHFAPINKMVLRDIIDSAGDIVNAIKRRYNITSAVGYTESMTSFAHNLIDRWLAENKDIILLDSAGEIVRPRPSEDNNTNSK